jgi:hypothetical protein
MKSRIARARLLEPVDHRVFPEKVEEVVIVERLVDDVPMRERALGRRCELAHVPDHFRSETLGLLLEVTQ